MLSVEKCKKYLNNSTYTNEEIETIRNSLYQVAELLIGRFIKDRNNKRKVTENQTEKDLIISINYIKMTQTIRRGYYSKGKIG